MAHSGEIERVLRENGLTDRPDLYDSSIHSWRCEHPDRYGPCDCFAELVADLAALFPPGSQDPVWVPWACPICGKTATANLTALGPLGVVLCTCGHASRAKPQED